MGKGFVRFPPGPITPFMLSQVQGSPKHAGRVCIGARGTAAAAELEAEVMSNLDTPEVAHLEHCRRYCPPKKVEADCDEQARFFPTLILLRADQRTIDV
jgi:hypothetical protein